MIFQEYYNIFVGINVYELLLLNIFLISYICVINVLYRIEQKITKL